MAVEAAQAPNATPVASARPLIHPAWVRVTHWINAVAVALMMMSGWEIYNASPLFPFRFPRDVTLGGWLAGALAWHFAAMWLFAVNGIVYVALGFATGRFRRKFVPIRAGVRMHDGTELTPADVAQSLERVRQQAR